MPRISKRLAGPALIATGPATIYTVPALTKTIIRKIHLQNPSASPVTVTLSIGASAAGTRILDAFPLPAQGAGVSTNVLDLFGPYTLEAAEVLQAAAGTNNIVVIVVDGEESVLG